MEIVRCHYVCINEHSWIGKKAIPREFYEMLTAWQENCPKCGGIAKSMEDFDKKGNSMGGCVLAGGK